MNKITGKIVGYKVLKPDEPKLDLTALSKPKGINETIERDDVISGKTYKIRPSNGNDSYYITINNQMIDGIRYPMEMFINSKNVEHFQWIAAITRMISAVFRKGGDIHFIVDELSVIHDPIGGYWGKDRLTGKGKYYKSIIHELGSVVEEHLAKLAIKNGLVKPVTVESIKEEKATKEDADSYPPNATSCKLCQHRAVVTLDGCATCLNCGDSKCG
jgi:hypothetical protein